MRKKTSVVALLLIIMSSALFLSGCKETSTSADQYYIISSLDIQLFDDQQEDDRAWAVSHIKKSRDDFYLRIQPDKSLTWYANREKVVTLPGNDGYYSIGVTQYQLNNTNQKKPQLISKRNNVCIRDCVITLTLKPVDEDSDEIRLIKSKHTLLTTILTAWRLAQIDIFAHYPLNDFNGKLVSVGWPEISPHTMKLNYSDKLTEIQSDDNESIKKYLSWFNLPYHPENIRAYRYAGSQYHNGIVMAIKDSDPVTDLKPILNKMNTTVFDEGNGAIFYSDTESLTGLYYYYDTSTKILYLSVLYDYPDSVSESIVRDYSVIRTLNPDNAGIFAQESDLSVDKETFEKKFKSQLNSYIDKNTLTNAVAKEVNYIITSPSFFFHYSKLDSSSGLACIDLRELSDFFTNNPVRLSASLNKASVAEQLAALKTKYPQGRIYQDVFINDNPPRFYFISETNIGLTLQYRLITNDNDDSTNGNDLMTLVIVTQLLRQMSPLQLDPVDPVRIANFQKYQMNEHYISNGYNTTDDKQFIGFNSLLFRADTGEVIIRNPPENHVMYSIENGLIQARNANLQHTENKLTLYTKEGEELVSGDRFEFNQAGDAVIISQCCGTGVFDLKNRKWLIKPQLALISDLAGFYMARVHFRQPVQEIFNHQGKLLGSGTTIMVSVQNQQIMIFDGTIESGRWIHYDGSESENPLVAEPVTLPQGTFYITRVDDRITLLNAQAAIIIPAYDYSKYKIEKTGLWLWSVRQDKWIQPDIDQLIQRTIG